MLNRITRCVPLRQAKGGWGAHILLHLRVGPLVEVPQQLVTHKPLLPLAFPSDPSRLLTGQSFIELWTEELKVQRKVRPPKPGCGAVGVSTYPNPFAPPDLLEPPGKKPGSVNQSVMFDKYLFTKQIHLKVDTLQEPV